MSRGSSEHKYYLMAGGMTPILQDLDMFDLISTDTGQQQDDVLLVKSRSDFFLDTLIAQGQKRFVEGVDHQTISPLLAHTLRVDPSARELDAVISMLNDTLSTHEARSTMEPGSGLKAITIPSNLEDILVRLCLSTLGARVDESK